MTDRLVSQVIAEVAADSTPAREVSQVIAEVAWVTSADRQFSQVIAEIAWAAPAVVIGSHHMEDDYYDTLGFAT